MKLLQIAMSNTANSLLRIMNAGYLLRGGISFGDAYLDELGFFGPAVEEAYRLESSFADVPIVALNSDLGWQYTTWEENVTNEGLVNIMMTSRPMLVEKDKDTDKYFLNTFYQLEAFSSTLTLESEAVNIDNIIHVLSEVISQDKEKYNTNKQSFYKKIHDIRKVSLV